jgi:hypothetical protein
MAQSPCVSLVGASHLKHRHALDSIPQPGKSVLAEKDSR